MEMKGTKKYTNYKIIFYCEQVSIPNINHMLIM